MKKVLRRIGLLALFIVAALLIIPFLLPIPPETPPTTLADSAGQFVTVDGLQTYLIEAGPADGQAVILLHGLGGSTFSWRLNMDALADAGYRAIAIDRPGFGLTDKPLDFDYGHPSQADFVAALMDELAIERAVMVGHSAGGGVIAQIAVRHPDRVAGLVFVDGAVLSRSSGQESLGGIVAFPPLTRWVQVLAGSFLTPERFNDLLASAYGPDFEVTQEVENGYARVLDTENWQNGFVGLVRDAGNNYLPEATIATITAPTLIVWGAADTWVPEASGEQLRELLPQAKWRSYPNIGHLPMEEIPDAFNADLIAFLDGLE
jgi:pimeloyl-ACP methyl ester carboxylesterase